MDSHDRHSAARKTFLGIFRLVESFAREDTEERVVEILPPSKTDSCTRCTACMQIAQRPRTARCRWNVRERLEDLRNYPQTDRTVCVVHPGRKGTIGKNVVQHLGNIDPGGRSWLENPECILRLEDVICKVWMGD